MTQEEIISSNLLPSVILSLLEVDAAFKEMFKTAAPAIAADIESASTNPNCSCRNKVTTYVTMNTASVGALLYQFAIDNDLLTGIKALFDKAVPPAGATAAGRVAKTSIADWPDFAKTVAQSGLVFKHMSTSVIGDDVYVFFL
jgi:hypothetical protein